MARRTSSEASASNVHSFRCPDDLFEFAQEEAARKGLPGGVSDLIRLLLQQLRERNEHGVAGS